LDKGSEIFNCNSLGKLKKALFGIQAVLEIAAKNTFQGIGD
jgi:hypothetical protein